MLIELKNVTIGADPELFVVNEKTGQYVSPHEYFPGTKEVPFNVDKGALQLDGLAAELNIIPAHNKEEFINNLNTVMQQANKFLPPYHHLVPKASVEFEPLYFKNLPLNTKLLGCTPDFNAWKGGEQNIPPPAFGTMRAAGGHIHVGFGSNFDIDDPEFRSLCCALVRQMDCVVGVSSLLWDSDNIRRNIYGKAGAMRFKSYGFEHRTLSSAWLRSEELMGTVYDLTLRAINEFIKGNYLFNKYPEVENIINIGDTEAARKLCNAIL